MRVPHYFIARTYKERGIIGLATNPRWLIVVLGGSDCYL